MGIVKLSVLQGVLPRNGRNIKFTEFAKVLESTYNLSPSLCMGILMSIAGLFQRDVSVSLFLPYASSRPL